MALEEHYHRQSLSASPAMSASAKLSPLPPLVPRGLDRPQIPACFNPSGGNSVAILTDNHPAASHRILLDPFVCDGDHSAPPFTMRGSVGATLTLRIADGQIHLVGRRACPAGGWSNHTSQGPQAGRSTSPANRSGDIEHAPAKVTGRGGVALSGRTAMNAGRLQALGRKHR